MMMIRTPLLTLLAGFLSVALVAAPARGAEEKKKGTDSELGKQMEELGKSVKALKKSVKDPAKNEESLKLVVQAQQSALASKQLSPAVLEKAPAADRPKLLSGYRKSMAVVVADLCKLEQQLIDGKNDEAAETLKNLKTLEDEGHEKYNP
jgi:soluble cytochrome b562